MRNPFLFVLILLPVFVLHPSDSGAAIVNTLRGFSSAEPGWSGSMSASYRASGGNTEESSLAAGAQLQWRQGDEIIRLLGTGKRTSTRGTETARAVLGHLRHNHRLGQRWSSLSFLQLQENPFQRLKSRTLLGAGFRCDLAAGSEREFALGAALMWEREHLESQDDHSTASRLSIFASYIRTLREGVEVDALLFYQPDTGDFGDYRLFGTVRLEVELAGNLSLLSGFQAQRDSRPPLGVDQTDWETTTGLKASF